MKIDLVGPRRRGLAMGLNEFAGYLAVAVAALGAGYLAAAYGPEAAPFWIAGAAVVLGLLVTLLFVRDTDAHVALESAAADGSAHRAWALAGPHRLARRDLSRRLGHRAGGRKRAVGPGRARRTDRGRHAAPVGRAVPDCARRQLPG
ncbi:MAG: MFS transporter, partial [Dehalococcoidia bacterium]